MTTAESRPAARTTWEQMHRKTVRRVLTAYANGILTLDAADDLLFVVMEAWALSSPEQRKAA